MLETLPTPIVVVCHDAGAANIIYSWIESCIQASPGLANSIRIYSQGPANYLLDNFDIKHVVRCSSLDDAMKNSQTLLAGTGWASTLELQALDQAKKMGIRTISVIDHWINYSDRFCIEGWQVNPDEIWVTDSYAKNIADKTFPGIEIEQKPNLYIARTVDRINALSNPSCSKLKVLYVLEPFRKAWVKGRENGEFDALEYFFLHMDELFHSPVAEVRLRPHPSDPPGKYDRWLDSPRTFEISIDVRPELEQSIAWADVVVGCQTMAMVISVESGKRVICSMPPWAPHCALPHEEIEKMALMFLETAHHDVIDTSN